MKRIYTFVMALVLLMPMSQIAFAQEGSRCGQPYAEADDGKAADMASWAQLKAGLHAYWCSRDKHHAKREVPSGPLRRDTIIRAWRGERIGVEAVLFSRTDVPTLSLRLTARSTSGDSAPMPWGTARFMRYVLTDDFRSCGIHPNTLSPRLVPDVIDLDNALPLPSCTTRPVWLTIEVPNDAKPGNYNFSLNIEETASHRVVDQLNLRLEVLPRTLPLPHEQSFHLDFWQQPYSLARMEGVEPWSDDHFRLLRPYMELLARAGQDVVSTILFYEPWGDQSHDKFSAMVRTVRKRDGTWSYDYTIFDRWVEFMAECGITKQIDCYSMVPWDMSFRYYDETSAKDVDLKTTTSSIEYEEIWTAFLRSFATHLKAKGWFDKTLIAMDERGLASMQDALRVAQQAVPGIGMALAGNYHSELADVLADYSVALGQAFPLQTLHQRRMKGWHTTFYTSCADEWPNLFTNSNPAEAAFLPLMAIANDFDGYLHWSWMNWPDNPLRDSRFRLFPPGDTYCIYPGPRSSVRWERFIEGVEQAEKMRILKEEYEREGNGKQLERLNAALQAFRLETIKRDKWASVAVNGLEKIVND